MEGCTTALLQGVPDAPICHSKTDANGEFSFGLVPAGEYKLLALARPPGQVAVSYNVRPESVPFTVRHDSLFIKNAFEVSFLYDNIFSLKIRDIRLCPKTKCVI